MSSRNRELVWKTPYKPPQATESESPQILSTSRRTSSLSPRSRPDPVIASTSEFTFPRPKGADPSTEDRSTNWTFLGSQSPPSPNMADPTTVNEVGTSKFRSDKTRGPGANSYTFFPLLTTAETQTEKAKMIASLRNHSVNTLSELRRIERIFATMGTSDLTEPMTTACTFAILC